MYIFRTMSSGELITRINKEVKTFSSSMIKGQNTANYQEGKEYIHFFKYLEHALYYMKKNNDPIVVKIELPSIIIPKLEYGLYGDVDTYYDDSLVGYYMPLPKYIIERNLFQKEFIVDFTHNGVWQDPLRKNDYRYFENTFWTEQLVKNRFKKETIKQRWDEEKIYYEYIKSLMPRFNYETEKIAKYLKNINLEEELQKMKEYIKENQVITKRRYPRKK